MQKSFFFSAETVGGSPDRIYTASDIAQREALLISDGVFGDDSLEVIATASDCVYVNEGGAIISGYTYLNTSFLTLPIGAGDGAYPRIDTVALKLDLSAREITSTVVAGTPAPVPQAPELVSTSSEKYLPLADVYVFAGNSGITQDRVTDRRTPAGLSSMTDSMRLLLREQIGAAAPLTGDELESVRVAAGTVKVGGSADTVLCGDGVYRKYSAPVAVVAQDYTEPGDYVFDPAAYPSDNGLYMIEVQGGGGAGGAYSGSTHMGGGGGGGGYVTLSHLPLRLPSYKITVGAGGVGVPGGSGLDGEPSSFGEIIAEGGQGGGGGPLISGGCGGDGTFPGANGGDGRKGASDPNAGHGGASAYGVGAPAPEISGECEGISATEYGEGGSGGVCRPGTFAKAGGCGGGGRVTVYRYLSGGEA